MLRIVPHSMTIYSDKRYVICVMRQKLLPSRQPHSLSGFPAARPPRTDNEHRPEPPWNSRLKHPYASALQTQWNDIMYSLYVVYYTAIHSIITPVSAVPSMLETRKSIMQSTRKSIGYSVKNQMTW